MTAGQPTTPVDGSGTPAASPQAGPRRRWLRRALVAASLLGIIALVSAELVARFLLRMGDPPLYRADAQCEYLMVPSRSYFRFRFTSTYNAWSMRATPDFAEEKGSPEERRILVFGDSVVNGGPQTDDKALATTLIPAQLQSLSGRPTIVANVSAGGWSPGNMLGYAKKFGFFDADVVVIVLNNGDAFDHPSFRPLGRDFPTRTPALALQEVFLRYIPNYLDTKFGKAGTVSDQPEANPRALAALVELVALARASGAKVAAVLHPTKTEITAGPKPGTKFLTQALADAAVPVVDARPFFANGVDAGVRPYRDDVHPSRDGQAVLAAALRQAITQAR
ncbi:MAG: GDSL-type esterase/lipase family protein [Phycisphaerales bacterium]